VKASEPLNNSEEPDKMFERKAIKKIIHQFIEELTNAGYSPDEVFLF